MQELVNPYINQKLEPKFKDLAVEQEHKEGKSNNFLWSLVRVDRRTWKSGDSTNTFAFDLVSLVKIGPGWSGKGPFCSGGEFSGS